MLSLVALELVPQALPPAGWKTGLAGAAVGGALMAGFSVLWASEFIPAAAETYRANHPETIV